MNNTPMHFLYASDEGFSTVLIASLHSLFSNHRGTRIVVHIIGQDLSEATCGELRSLAARFDQSVDLIDMPTRSELFDESVDTKRFTLSAFSRLFADTLLDESVERVIYLDCDTVVMRNLSSLWEFDLGGATIGAVNDCRNGRYLEHLGCPKDGVYINSGVLLIDLERYRAGKWQARFREAIATFNGLLEFPDNDLICMLMQDELAVLPPEYNMISPARTFDYDELTRLRRPTRYYPRDVFERAQREPAILHYTTFFGLPGRPWLDGYDDEDGLAFRGHLAEVNRPPLPARPVSSTRRAAAAMLAGPLRPVAVRLFGMAHSMVKPMADAPTRRRILALREERAL